MITQFDVRTSGATVAGDYERQHPGAAATSGQGVPESIAWPDPSTQLAQMASSTDPGVAIAALALQNNQRSQNASKLARDAAYAAEESAQQDELRHMREAAAGRFGAGLLQGGLQLVSAGATLASAAPTARAGELGNSLTTMEAGPGRAAAIAEKADLDGLAGYLTGAAKGADAGATLAPTFGKLMSENEDRAAKGDSFRSARAKREGEAQGERVKENDRSIEKAMAFLKEWIATRDATANALARRV